MDWVHAADPVLDGILREEAHRNSVTFARVRVIGRRDDTWLQTEAHADSSGLEWAASDS